MKFPGLIAEGEPNKLIECPLEYSLSDDGSTAYGVTFGLTKAGAEKFHRACIDNGATTNPNAHNVMMLLDDKVFYYK